MLVFVNFSNSTLALLVSHLFSFPLSFLFHAALICAHRALGRDRKTYRYGMQMRSYLRFSREDYGILCLRPFSYKLRILYFFRFQNFLRFIARERRKERRYFTTFRKCAGKFLLGRLSGVSIFIVARLFRASPSEQFHLKRARVCRSRKIANARKVFQMVSFFRDRSIGFSLRD